MKSKLARSPEFQIAPYSLVLLVGAVEDRDELISQLPWRTRRVCGFREARALLNQDLVRVVVCERALPDGDWRDLLDAAPSRQCPPPIIVTSCLADERLWAEVLNLGGYDVLAKPLDRDEALRAIGLAWERMEGREAFTRSNGSARTPIDDSYIYEIERDEAGAPGELPARHAAGVSMIAR
jgi:DNA-binding NtrC family response regulator